MMDGFGGFLIGIGLGLVLGYALAKNPAWFTAAGISLKNVIVGIIAKIRKKPAPQPTTTPAPLTVGVPAAPATATAWWEQPPTKGSGQ
jgi:hypothetical protein